MVGPAPWIRLARPANGIISLVGTVVAGLSVVGLSAPRLGEVVLALIILGLVPFLVTSAGNALNDYLDAEGDEVNHPNRPIPSGMVTRKGALRYSIALFALSPVPMLLLLPLNLFPSIVGPGSMFWLLLIWAASVALLLGYELKLKQEGLAGNASVAWLTGGVFLFGGAALGRPYLALPWAAMAFFATLSREIIKDMEDVKGDEARRTLPRTHGMAASAIAGRSTVVVALALSSVPLLTWLPLRSVAGLAYLGIVGLSDVTFLLSVVWLPRQLHREQGLSKVAMVLALGAFLGASLR